MLYRRRYSNDIEERS